MRNYLKNLVAYPRGTRSCLRADQTLTKTALDDIRSSLLKAKIADKQIMGHIFKKRIMWFGWITTKETKYAPLYYDNVCDEIGPETMAIVYFTIALRKDTVKKRMMSQINSWTHCKDGE